MEASGQSRELSRSQAKQSEARVGEPGACKCHCNRNRVNERNTRASKVEHWRRWHVQWSRALAKTTLSKPARCGASRKRQAEGERYRTTFLEYAIKQDARAWDRLKLGLILGVLQHRSCTQWERQSLFLQFQSRAQRLLL